MDFSFRDNLRVFIERRSDGRNTVMYDQYGNPNVMVCIPKYTLRDIGLDSDNTHPGFIFNGREVNEILVSKYVASKGDNNVPIHMPGCVPWTNISFNDAKVKCANMGKGWHMITNAEWAAFGLAVIAAGSYTTCGRYIDFVKSSPGKTWRKNSDGVYLTGCGPKGGNHDRTEWGICDTIGFVDQFVDGIVITDGIQMRIKIAGESIDEPMSISDNLVDTRYGFDSNASMPIAVDSINVGSEHFANENNPSVMDVITTHPQAKVGCFTTAKLIGFDALGITNINQSYKASGSYANVRFSKYTSDRVMTRGGSMQAVKAGILDYNVTISKTDVSPLVGFRAVYVSL